MKYIDFIGQTLLLVATLVLAAILGGTGILIGQFFLGALQMISSILSAITNTPFRKKKQVHLVSALIYLAALAVIVTNNLFSQGGVSFVMMMVPAWILAIYYYVITWTWMFSDSNRSKFLPNISF